MCTSVCVFVRVCVEAEALTGILVLMSRRLFSERFHRSGVYAFVCLTLRGASVFCKQHIESITVIKMKLSIL